MKSEIVTQGMTAADLDKLDLIADVQFNEPMGSAALNRKFYGIMPHGIYRGFQAVVRGGLKVSVGDSPVNVAAVDVDGYMISVQGRRPVELTVPTGRKVYCVIEANYAVGLRTTQVDMTASMKAADIRMINADELRGNHVIVFSANLPANTTELRADQIDLTERQEADIGSDAIDRHTKNYLNPHQVNKGQIGLGDVENFGVATLEEAKAGEAEHKYMTPATTAAAITEQAGAAVSSHTGNKNNPHAVTKAQVGLGSVQDYGVASTAEAQAGTAANKYMTPALTKAAITEQAGAAVSSHTGNKNNPHAVTKAQVGLGSVQDYGVASAAEAQAGTVTNKYMTPALTKAAITEQAGAAVSSHTGNKNNPHAVTKAQVGLGSVNNWGATSATNDASDTKYATASAVKKVSDLAETKLASNVREVVAQDWNTLTTAGSYTISAMTGANKPEISGAPPVYGYGTLFVQNTGKEICQIYIADNNRMYIRDKYYNNSWGTWSAVSCDESVVINTSADLNDYTMGGTFNLYKGEGVTFTNAPSGLSFGTLQVIGRGQASASFVTQILTWKDDGRQMIRTRNDGSFSWTPWRKIYSEAQKPTKADVGLGSVQDYGVASTAEAQAGTVTNKYMTPALTKAAITEQAGAAVSSHTGNKNNPHAVTKAQVGLGSVQDYGIATTAEAQAGTAANKYMTPALTKAAITEQAGAAVSSHTGNKNNPHAVTKAQVGLGSVNDWGATGATNDASDAKYATAGAVKKAYDLANGKMTQAQGDARYYRFIKALGSADNLNNIVATGIYHNSMNANATAANNYPTTNAGYLEVFAEGSMVYQRYHSYQANNHVYYRGRYNSTWSAWRRAKGADESTAWSTLTGIPVQATRWPTSSEVGLGSVNNWPATAATNDASDAKYATAGAVKKAYDLANGKAPASHNHAWGNITGVPVYATRWPTAAEAGAAPASHTHSYLPLSGGTLSGDLIMNATGGRRHIQFAHGGSAGTTYVYGDPNDKTLKISSPIHCDGNGNFNDVHIRSDRRLKSNFEPITDALEKVSQLHGQLYDKAGVREAGLIAQDVQAVQPESVHESKEGMLTIAPAGVVALLVEAVKELRSENIALKARLDQMGA